jgi:SAM-dependent methyltransferase
MSLDPSVLARVQLSAVEACPLCSSQKRSVFATPLAANNPIKAMRCDGCGLVYTDTAVEPADVSKMYAGYSNRDTVDPELARKRATMYELDRIYAETFLSAGPASILDLGCADGAFLSQFRADYQKFGIEVDADARQSGAAMHPEIVFLDSLERLQDDQRFDAILMRGTIQYMPDLKALAVICKERLLQNGKLIILATPNLDSILAQLQREHWVLFDTIEHRYCFGISQLQRLFSDGFSMLAYDLPYFGTPYENYLRDFQKVIAMFENAEARKERVPFFGSMLRIVFQRTA